MLRKTGPSDAPLVKSKSSTEIVAVRDLSVDVNAQFVALLRRKVTRAAATGALTAAIEAIPGLGSVMGFVFGELLDATFLTRVQRELVEDVFVLYELQLPAPMHAQLVDKVCTFGTSASIAGDAFIRGMVKRSAGRFGSALTRRFVPVANILSSAISNATVTYAIGKRAQAVAKWRDAPMAGMPDVVRAFSGVDERRVYDWSMDAVKTSLGMIGSALKRMLSVGRNRSSAAPSAASRKR